MAHGRLSVWKTWQFGPVHRWVTRLSPMVAKLHSLPEEPWSWYMTLFCAVFARHALDS